MGCRQECRWLTGSRTLIIVSGTVLLLSCASIIAAVLYFFLSANIACDIPDIDPFDETILEFIHEPDVFECSSHDPLTYTSLEEGRQVLRIREDAVHHYNTSLEQLDCCYSVITRENDDEYKESDCYKFVNEAYLEYDVEFIYVQCLDSEPSVKLNYTNMHAVIQIKPSLHHIPPSDTPTERGGINERRPNVLLLGIDGVSRLSLKRTMPKTVAHLLANNWVELNKYNKVADNTYPNFMAILTGKNEEQLYPIKCFANTGTSHDHCPFIWKDFKQKGYVTAYAEDETDQSTFNWNEDYRGFLSPPTDYYFRTFALAAEKKLVLKRRLRFSVCLGPTPTTDIFLKYTKDLLDTFRNSFFALTWLNNFSHDDLTLPASVDATYLQYMQDLETTGTLKNTVVIFLSDHGVRYGPIRTTYVGWFEERLPFIYIWVPVWFRETYPTAYQNLVDNGNRLTSPYDLYLMMKDLADGSVGNNNAGSGGCPTCMSLFSPIENDRSCGDAGVNDHWCACSRQRDIPVTGNVVSKAAQYAVDHIEKALLPTKNDTHSSCARLELKEIVNARQKYKQDNDCFVDYVIVFVTTPGLALFDATVRHLSGIATPQFEIIGIISRINAYGKQSACINIKELKLYCFCK